MSDPELEAAFRNDPKLFRAIELYATAHTRPTPKIRRMVALLVLAVLAIWGERRLRSFMSVEVARRGQQAAWSNRRRRPPR
jgi:hypothetical protein